MKYNILVCNLEKLEKKIKRAINKGAPIIFIKGEKVYVKDPDFPNVKHPAIECEVDGKYIINGWRFVATLEHKETGNVIRKVDSSLDVPEYYKTCEPRCDHCKSLRRRKDTYIIYNEEDKKFMQVGRTCLKDFTCGLDANLCAEIAGLIDNCEKLEGYLSDEDFYSFVRGFNSDPCYFTSKEVFKLAISLVKSRGYDRDTSRNIVLQNLIHKGIEVEVNPCSPSLYKKVIEWIDALDDENDYFRSCKVLAHSQKIEYRDFNFFLSIVNKYFKETRMIKSNKSEWVGEIGDRIDIDVDSYRVLFQNYYRVNSYVSVYSFTYEIIDRKGNNYILHTSKRLDEIEDEDGDPKKINVTKIKATVSEHSEYKTIKQTVIKRFKLLAYEELEEEEETPANPASKAIDNFLQSIE